MPMHAGPPHDRVRLTAEERRIIADVERCLAEEARAVARARTWLGHRAGTFAGRLYRHAPWLLALSALVTLVIVAVGSGSPFPGVLGAVVTSALAVPVVVRLTLFALARVEARRASPAPPGR
jgi:hypothetical protein